MDIHDIQLRPEAMELAMFQNVVMRHIEVAKETLMKKYVILVHISDSSFSFFTSSAVFFIFFLFWADWCETLFK